MHICNGMLMITMSVFALYAQDNIVKKKLNTTFKQEMYEATKKDVSANKIKMQQIKKKIDVLEQKLKIATESTEIEDLVKEKLSLAEQFSELEIDNIVFSFYFNFKEELMKDNNDEII